MECEEQFQIFISVSHRESISGIQIGRDVAPSKWQTLPSASKKDVFTTQQNHDIEDGRNILMSSGASFKIH